MPLPKAGDKPPKIEERKRQGWGAQKDAAPVSNARNPSSDKPTGMQKVNSGAKAEKPNKLIQKKPSSYDNHQQPNSDQSPNNKQKKQDDWNYLKQTLKTNNQMHAGQGAPGEGNDEEQLDPNLLTFHEKADELIEEQEEFRGKHFEYLKEAAKMLTEEGDLISNV